jgi:hypothetical protein
MAIAVQANIAIAWPSATAVPTGWVHVAELDSVYVVGAAAGADTDLTTVRGNATHTHTSPSHNPIQDAHIHTGSGTRSLSSTVVAGTQAVATPGTTTTHSHTYTSDAATATNNAVAITVDAATNDLAYTAVVWIKSDGTPPSFPAGSLIHWDTDSLPAGWTRAAAGNYLKGAASGGATGGANTHTHTSPAHTHTQNEHVHTGTSDPPSIARNLKNTGTSVPNDVHTHTLQLGGAPNVYNNATTITIAASNHEPPYIYANTITSASNGYPVGAIAIWLGANTAIPTGWTRATSLDSFWVKSASADGQVLGTGGATTHSHTATDCQPTQIAHTHTVVDQGVNGAVAHSGTLSASPSLAHVHPWSASTETATNQAAAVTINVCTAGAAYPLYRTVIFVKLVTPQDGTPTVVGPTWTTTWRTGYREDIHTQDLVKAAYRQRRRGEG